MIEQEMASIIRFVLSHTREPTPYYWNVPANFLVPAAYFPPPEIESGGETFLTYYVDYVWYIKIFHTTAQRAYSLGYAVVCALRAERNLVPLISPEGNVLEREWVRVDDPGLKILDDGAAELTIRWRNRRPYRDVEEGATRAWTYYFDVLMKSGGKIPDSDAEAGEIHSAPLKTTGNEPE